MVEPMKAQPLLRTTPSHRVGWEMLQQSTQDMISYFLATLRRTW